MFFFFLHGQNDRLIFFMTSMKKRTESILTSSKGLVLRCFFTFFLHGWNDRILFFLWISLSKNFEIKVDQFYVNQKIRKWKKQSRPGKAFFWHFVLCVCDNLYKWMDFLLLIWTNEIRGVLFLNFQEFHPNFLERKGFSIFD